MAETTTTPDVATKTRPTRPDEAAYKADLAKAEKEHAAVQEKLVSCNSNWTRLFTFLSSLPLFFKTHACRVVSILLYVMPSTDLASGFAHGWTVTDLLDQ